MKRTLALLMPALLLSVSLSCRQEGGAKDVTARCESLPPAALALIGESAVTEADLNRADEGVREGLIEAEEQFKTARREALDGYLMDRLLEVEASASGIGKDALFDANVTGKIKPVTDMDKKAFYDEWTGKLPPGRKPPPLENVSAQIARKLEQDREEERRAEYFVELKKKHKVAYVERPETFERPRSDVGTGTNPGRGAKDAPVTIVEFSSFLCGHCRHVQKTLERVLDTYRGKVMLYKRDFPLGSEQAKKAAEAVRCAGEQGKFWEYNHALWDAERPTPEELKAVSVKLNLDTTKFDTCLSDGRTGPQVDADVEAAAALGVSGTPAFFINGIRLAGARPFEAFARIIDAELSREGRSSPSKPAMP